MRKKLTALVPALIPWAALGLCACLGTDSGKDPGTGSRWTGLALRSCGPADGPAVNFELDTKPMTCDAPATGAIHLQSGVSLESLEAPTTFGWVTDANCDQGSDPVTEALSLQLTRMDSDSATVHFRRIRTHPCAAHPVKPDTLEGEAEVKVCRDRPSPPCG